MSLGKIRVRLTSKQFLVETIFLHETKIFFLLLLKRGRLKRHLEKKVEQKKLGRKIESLSEKHDGQIYQLRQFWHQRCLGWRKKSRDEKFAACSGF